MAGEIRYDRLILILSDDELEEFCLKWVEKKKEYLQVHRYAGPNDKGRDVVGFKTNRRHEGEWDNYQCKQYHARVSRSEGLLAIGKVLYWAWKGEFIAPDHFFFVAPRGLTRPLQSILDKPSELRDALINEWESICARAITEKETIVLEPELMAFIEKYPFNMVREINLDGLLSDPAARQLLVERWGADPGQYPMGVVPPEVQEVEMGYIDELVDAYRERTKLDYSNYNAVLEDPKHGLDLQRHRERFFEADAFQKFYRDNTTTETIDGFRKDIEHGVIDRWQAPAIDLLSRIQAVMELAGTVIPAGPLAKYARVPVKQGICHHFVNEGQMTWKIS